MHINEAIKAQIEIINSTWVKPTLSTTDSEAQVLAKKLEQAHALFGFLAEKVELLQADNEQEKLSEYGDVFYYLIASLLAFDYEFIEFLPGDDFILKTNLLSFAQKYFRGKEDYKQSITAALEHELYLFSVNFYGVDLQEMINTNRTKLMNRVQTSTIVR